MSSKWIEITEAERGAAELAAEIIQLRMCHVEQLLPLAAHNYRDDIEYVHQLRVGCRRAGAALGAFRPLVTGKAKRLKKWLRKIRQAAGPARDADVLLERLKAQSKPMPGHEYLVARLKRRRANVQQALVEVAAKAETGRLEQSVTRCLKALQKKPPKRAAVRFDLFAHQALRSVSQQMLQRSGLQQPTIAQLHQLRIAGKRLRYSIEIFHGVFPLSLREEIYPLVEKIQARLGSLNDHATAQALFQGWLADLPPDERAAQLAARIVAEHDLAEQIHLDFLQWWTPKRVAALESHLSMLMHVE